jgi:leucyl-tRNA synthetase
MAVPAHDTRDMEFAKKFNLPIKSVIAPQNGHSGEISNDSYIVEESVAINSGEFNGLSTSEFKKKIIAYITKNKLGKKSINYKLRDWVFSRQHYWGEPIPIIKCERCGNIPLKEKDLPLELPKVKNYEPTDTGESPLAGIKNWVDIKCPVCGGPAKRETDTMPNWAGSSWYFLRYIDPKNNKVFADRKKIDYWMPVDLYNGGMEHTTLHLLYSRFWHKFLFDLGYVPAAEPYKARRSHGMIIAEDGQKMSKSRGNVVNPDDIITSYGADTLRVYEMFMGPYSEAIAWNTNSMIGVNRFLERVWNLQDKVKVKVKNNEEIESLVHKTIKKITEDIDELKFNTAVSQLMILANAFEKQDEILKKHFETFIILLSPFAPHITEEIWENLGNKKSVHLNAWPVFNPKFIKEKEIELVVQVNGKIRDKIQTPANISEADAKKIALESEKVQKWFEGKTPRKVIFVKGKLVSIVI